MKRKQLKIKNKQLKERLDIIRLRNDPRVKALDKELKFIMISKKEVEANRSSAYEYLFN
ncbi:MAG: hypothetical protein WAS34_18820 [Thiolinea sp.]